MQLVSNQQYSYNEKISFTQSHRFPYLDISCDYAGHIGFSIGPKITFLLKSYPKNIHDMYGFDMLNYASWHRSSWTSNLCQNPDFVHYLTIILHVQFGFD